MVIDAISWFCLMLGCFFCFSGGVGILRFPDFFTRMHAASVTDSLGAILILVGLMFQAGLTLITVKLAFILLFLLLTGPASSHAMAKAALHSGHKPMNSDKSDDATTNSTDGGDVSNP